MSLNVFLLLSKYLLAVSFKKFKTNKAILTIVKERKESGKNENIPRKYFSPKKIIKRSVWGLVFGWGFELTG